LFSGSRSLGHGQPTVLPGLQRLWQCGSSADKVVANKLSFGATVIFFRFFHFQFFFLLLLLLFHNVSFVFVLANFGWTTTGAQKILF
jgi:hypothetical protein